MLVKLFKNNVFAGSVQCEDGSYSIKTDLFVGTNELVARVYDDLDQPGPDSNVLTVNELRNVLGFESLSDAYGSEIAVMNGATQNNQGKEESN